MKFVDVIFAVVVSVYDGDTLKVDISDCKIDVLCKGLEVRLKGFDTPEMHGKCQKEKDLALQAKKITEGLYPVGSTVVLSNNERDKYFRLLSEQPIIAQKQIALGLAVPYAGEKKTKDWCL